MDVWPRLQRCRWEKKNRRVCIFYSLLCSLNSLFEGGDRSQKALGGGTVGNHLDSNSTTGCFFGGHAGVSGEVGFGLASKLWLLQRLKAAIEGGRAFQHLPKAPGNPLHSRTRLYAGIHFGWNFTVAILEDVGVEN